MDVRQELAVVQENLRQIQAFASAPHWTAERRWKIEELSQRALQRVESLLEAQRAADERLTNPVAALIDAFVILAPQLSDAQAIAMSVGQMLVANETEKAICQTIVCALLDGLAYGNWPSTRMEVKPL